MANQITTEIVLDLDTLKAQLKKAEDEGAKSGKKMGDGLGGGAEDGLLKMFGGLKGKIAALAAGVVGAFSLKKMIDEASGAEQAMNSFSQALASTGHFSQAAVANFAEYAASLQRITTVSDDAIIANASYLASVGRLSGEGLKQATKSALDLSAALGIDTQSAFQIVAKAANGHAEVLNRYGITIRKTGDDARDFATAMSRVHAQFGGAAEAKALTFAGSMEKLGNSFNDVLESLGNLIIKSPKLATFIRFLGEQFAQLATSLDGLGKGRDVVGDILLKLIDMAKVITQYVAPVVELFFNGFINGFLAIKAGVLAIGGLFSNDLAEKAKVAFADLSESSAKLFDFPVSDAANNFIEKTQAVVAAVKEPIKQGVREIANAVVEPLPEAWDYIVNGFNSAFSRVALTSQKFRDELQMRLNSAFQSFRLGVANSFASIGAALVKGENAFAAFGKAILGVFGDLAIQLGSFYFLMGLGNLFLNPAAGAAQIAAGLGLIVLGGALKAIAGGGGGAAAGAGGGVASAGGGGLEQPATSSSAALSQPQKQEPQTNITVQVQGNILDRRQTGLELAEVIQESFGSNGVVFATGG